MAVDEMLRPGTELARRLEWSGPAARTAPGPRHGPAWRRWATHQTRQAYQQGFIQGLTQDPAATVLAIIGSGHA